MLLPNKYKFPEAGLSTKPIALASMVFPMECFPSIKIVLPEGMKRLTSLINFLPLLLSNEKFSNLINYIPFLKIKYYNSNKNFIIVKYMNIQCPNCETIFALPQKGGVSKKYKCSVCNHIWIENSDKYLQSLRKEDPEKSNLKMVVMLNIIIFLLATLTLIVFRNYLENIDSFWQNLYLFFDTLIPIQ